MQLIFPQQMDDPLALSTALQCNMHRYAGAVTAASAPVPTLTLVRTRTCGRVVVVALHPRHSFSIEASPAIVLEGPACSFSHGAHDCSGIESRQNPRLRLTEKTLSPPSFAAGTASRTLIGSAPISRDPGSPFPHFPDSRSDRSLLAALSRMPLMSVPVFAWPKTRNLTLRALSGLTSKPQHQSRWSQRQTWRPHFLQCVWFLPGSRRKNHTTIFRPGLPFVPPLSRCPGVRLLPIHWYGKMLNNAMLPVWEAKEEPRGTPMGCTRRTAEEGIVRKYSGYSTASAGQGRSGGDNRRLTRCH